MAARPTSSIVFEVLVLAALLCVFALFFAIRQFLERRARADDLDAADHLHFRWKDLRRWAGCGLMVAIAGLMFATTRIEPTTRANARIWMLTWLVAMAALLVLLLLALFDWISNRRYAARHRRALHEEVRDFWAQLASRGRPRSENNGRSRKAPPRLE